MIHMHQNPHNDHNALQVTNSHAELSRFLQSYILLVANLIRNMQEGIFTYVDFAQ